MMTSADLFVSLVAGLAVPLAILDAARTMMEGQLPVQSGGLQLERRWMPWLLTVMAGPALMFDRVAEGWREGALSRSDLATGAFITVGWAVLYGFIFLKGVQLFAE